MKRRISSWIMLCALIANLSFVNSSDATTDSAWQALHELRVSEAKTLFEEELEKSPTDHSLLRGLCLASYFNLDYEAMTNSIKRMAELEPANVYNYAVFELVYAELEDWAQYLDIQRWLGDGLSKQGNGAIRYLGKHIQNSVRTHELSIERDKALNRLGIAPGCWVTGPFENQYNIAAYRNIPFESEPLDTLDTSTAKRGSKSGWTWVDAGVFGEITPSDALESLDDVSVQARTFFELSETTDVNLLFGVGASVRMYVDGSLVHNEPLYRNSSLREGVRLTLDEGIHEIALVLSMESLSGGFEIIAVDTAYDPIEGLEWRRYGEVEYDGEIETSMIHPIFDPFEQHISMHGDNPDTRFWRAVLRIHNGYWKEAVQELEALYDSGELSALETWVLCWSLTLNGEAPRAAEYLTVIKDSVSCPTTDMQWVDIAAEGYEETVREYKKLAAKYPGTPHFDLIAALEPAISGDNQTLVENLQRLKKTYPEFGATWRILSTLYSDFVGDVEASYSELKELCDMTGSRIEMLTSTPSYLIRLGRLEDAVDSYRENLEYFPNAKFLYSALERLLAKLGRSDELIPELEALHGRFPYCIEYHNQLHKLYKANGDFTEAEKIVREIHEMKPSAVRPHIWLDSLHNYVNYDSIFGFVDVASLWEIEPTPEERNSRGFWTLLDRRQKILFESGVVLKDIHAVYVCGDESVVEDYQSTYLGFDPQDDFKELLTARRLRKGQPPLSGTVDGYYVVFQDLRPGDAIELRYRIWESNSGDLWEDFWDNYIVHSDYYQRRWEYVILTERDDLRYQSLPPAPEPQISEHCGFRKISWSGSETPAWDLDRALLPPTSDILGKIIVSTIPDWEFLNKWYESISEAILADNPRTSALAGKLTASLESDRAKLRALYEHVVINIPYQVIQFNYSSSTPSRPDEVLVNRWGDCKDKGHLLIAMLRSVGITAWPVLVMTRSQGTSLPLSTFEFDHVIVGCIIDGDTTFVDPSGFAYSPEASISKSIAGQPCMMIGQAQDTTLTRIPDFDAGNTRWDDRLTISLFPDSSRADFHYLSRSYNLEAGRRRNNLLGSGTEEIRRNLESYYSGEWGVDISIDSLSYDSLRTIDTVFAEEWLGSMVLTIQKITSTAVVNLPRWSVLSAELAPSLAERGELKLPVDLRSYAGHYDQVMKIHIPEEFGRAKLMDTVEISEPLYSFVFEPVWNEDERTLLLNFSLHIEDGKTDAESFSSFCRKVMECRSAPLLIESD